MKIKLRSLTFKIIASIFTFSILFISFITFYVKDVFTDGYMQLEKDKIDLISKQIAAPLSLNISYGFTEAVDDIANNALSNENILLIEIHNYATYEFKKFTNYTKTKNEHLSNNELHKTTQLNDPATNEEIATLTIIYSKSSFETYMNEFNKWFYFGVSIFGLSIIVLTFLLYRSLKKLRILDFSLQNFNPNAPQKISISSGTDEICSISKSANIMIDNIIEYNTNLIQSQNHLLEAQKMAKLGSFDYDANQDVLVLSEEYYRLLGIDQNTILNLNDFLSFISSDDFNRVKQAIAHALEDKEEFDIEYKIKTDANKPTYIRTRGSVDKEDEHKLTAVSMDITIDIENKKMIEKLAYYDPLTSLPNRTLLKDRTKKAIQNASRHGHKLAVIFLDLDHFKLINDTLGHSVGDELLVYIANLLKKQIRESDTISRLGGDEFVILFPYATNIENLVLKILNSLQQKHVIGSHDLYVTSSIGVAIYPEDGSDCDELIRNADTAMYEAKNDGRNKYKIYSKSMGNFVDKQLSLEQDLTEAVKNNSQIEVYYQAKIDTSTQSIAGAEALVRWRHPTRGLIFPDEFIYMAESTGLMIELGNIIIEKSIASVREFYATGYTNFKIAINLSARQFQDAELIPFISSMLQKYNVDAKYVELEITETISMTNMIHTLTILQGLKDLGVTIAIDDFGTGHSSLAYLKKFPIDVLKIDRSFVLDIIDDEEGRIIAQTIIKMAQSLGLKTVAEGVETQEHATMLKNMNCDLLQGYLYSKPISKEEFIQFIQDHNTKGYHDTTGEHIQTLRDSRDILGSELST